MISDKDILRLIFDLETGTESLVQDKETNDSIFWYVELKVGLNHFKPVLILNA